MQHLLEHFKDLTLHPKNAQELKGLILKLAVQGNLSKNSDSWEFGILSDLGSWAIGTGFPISEQGHDVGEIPFIKVSDMNLEENTKFIIKANHYISRETALKIKSKIHPEGTVVFPKIGGAIATNKRRILTMPTAIDNNCLGLIPNEKTSTEWIFLFLSSIDMMIYQSGTSVPALSQKVLEQIPSFLPPIEEQKAIVASVEKLFSVVEHLEAATKKRIQLKEDFVSSALRRLSTEDTASAWGYLLLHFKTFFTEKSSIKKLRESILQLAVQGKLTRDFRKSNPELFEGTHSAEALLERIKAEKAKLIKEGKIKKEKPLTAITEDKIPYELPEGWVWCRITDLTDVGTGSTPAKTNSSYYGGDIPWYTSSATNDDFAKVQEAMITQKALDETNCKIFPKGSLIIAMYGQGKTRGQISELVIPGATNQAIAAMVFFESSKLTKQYLKYYFQKFYHEIRLLAEGGAQPNLNVGKIKSTLIPLPPINELNNVVQKVDELMALCDRLEKEIETQKTTQEEWMQSCLREVFEGKKNEVIIKC